MLEKITPRSKAIVTTSEREHYLQIYGKKKIGDHEEGRFVS